jgi:hypothetical protein
MTGSALRNAAVTGLPFGRELNVLEVAVARGVTAELVGMAEGLPVTVTVIVDSGGTCVSGGGVSLGVVAKIAVWVRLGVGKVNGVGETAPGSVQAARLAAKIEDTSNRARLFMSTSVQPGWGAVRIVLLTANL